MTKNPQYMDDEMPEPDEWPELVEAQPEPKPQPDFRLDDNNTETPTK